MKRNDNLNDRAAVRSRRLKRLFLALIASYLPATLFVGIANGWGIGEWMIAWTGISIGTFATIAVLFGIVKCPMERQKGQPRKEKR